MQNNKIYSLIDSELEEILDKNPDNEALQKHKNRENNKGYALLIWFLAFYGQKKLFQNYITDGNGDNSCDIIFSNTDTSNNKIFYIIQSKWVKYDEKSKSYPKINSEEFKAVLTDFNAILSGRKQVAKNEKFNKKYEELIAHLEDNGSAKFIFFTLASFNAEIEPAVYSFNQDHGSKIQLEVIDIDKIKKDYIEFKFKEITVNNPLEYQYNPEDTEIKIELKDLKKLLN